MRLSRIMPLVQMRQRQNQIFKGINKPFGHKKIAYKAKKFVELVEDNIEIIGDYNFDSVLDCRKMKSSVYVYGYNPVIFRHLERRFLPYDGRLYLRATGRFRTEDKGVMINVVKRILYYNLKIRR